MTKTIHISDELYQAIHAESQSFEDTAESVLRRKYGIDGPKSKDVDTIEGELLPFLREGVIKAGDVLVWERPRRGERFVATVTANGAVRVKGGGVYASPSGAAVECAKQNTNGWIVWKHERLGKTLAEIRDAAKKDK